MCVARAGVHLRTASARRAQPLRRGFSRNGLREIGAAAVDDYQFVRGILDGDMRQRLRQRAFFIERRDNDGNQ